MKIKSEQCSNLLFYLLIMIVFILLTYIGFNQYEDISFHNESIYYLNDDWNYQDQDGQDQTVTLPTQVDIGNEKTIRISQNLPIDLSSITAIGIYTAHQSLNVYIDDTLIYTYQVVNKNRLFTMPSGGLWNIISLPENSMSKTLTLEITSEYSSYAGFINEVYGGTKAALLLHILHDNVVGLLISFSIIFVGLTLILINLIYKKILSLNFSLFYLGLSVILAALWMIMENKMAQYYINHNFIQVSLSFISLYLLPISFLKYIALIEKYRYKNLVLTLSNILNVNSIILVIFQVFNIMDFHESLFLLHYFMYSVFTIVLITLCIDYVIHKNKEIRYITLSFVFLFLFAVFELLAYKMNKEIQTGSFLQLGFLVFTIVLSWGSIIKLIYIIKMNETTKYYQYLATRDYLTKCKNRTAYDMDLENIAYDHSIGIILADIDCMKYINDTFGHHVGDEVLIQCSQNLHKIFGSPDNCYRIGGDEFVCIVINHEEAQLKHMIELFMKECQSSTIKGDYKYAVSVGYAAYDSNLDKSIYDTIRRADIQMYKEKLR